MSNRFRSLAAFTFVLALAARSILAAPAAEWTLTTSDFRSERVALAAITDKGVEIAAAGGGKHRLIGFDQFLQLERMAARAAPSGPFVIELRDGDRFSGEPRATEGETILWNSRSLGQLRLSMRRVLAIHRPEIDIAPAGGDERQLEDRVTLSNGDTITGVIASIDKTAATIQPSGGGDATVVPLDSIGAVTFASTVAPATAPAQPGGMRRYRVTLTDGTSFTSNSPTLDGENVNLQSSDARTTLPLDAVALIEQLNGPVIWLSSIAPSEIVQTPFLEMSWPTRMDRSVTGDVIRSGERAFSHGIGVHSYSRLSWPIDPSVRVFRTQFAVDGDPPYADVTVRVKLDGKVAYEQKNVRAGKLWPVVQIDTAGAHTIALEVDYGENADVQDRFNWIEPALLRYKPVAATQP